MSKYKTKTTLIIKELKVNTYIGFYPEERKKKQPVIITVSFEVNEPKAVKHDDVKYTVNYAEISKEIYDRVAKGKFNLLEKLGDVIAAIIMKRKQIKTATIEISKPEAPLPNTKGSAVRIMVSR